MRNTDFPTLETNRLRLRKLVSNDVREFFDLVSNPKVSEYNPWMVPQTLEDTEGFIEAFREINDPWELAIWGIQYDRKLVGICGFGNLSMSDNWAELQGLLAYEYWGKGIMTEAVQRIIHYGFHTMGLHRVEGKCITGNAGAEKVLQKIGMSVEGILKERIKVRGKYHDLKLYAILNK